jgi:hypothetical protein
MNRSKIEKPKMKQMPNSEPKSIVNCSAQIAQNAVLAAIHPCQTSMQELIFEVSKILKHTVNSHIGAYNLVLKLANTLIEKEKSQIIDAFENGTDEGMISKIPKKGIEYFNNTFKN